MDKPCVIPVKQNANLAGLAFSHVDTTVKRPLMFHNNVMMSNFILPQYFASFNDETSCDRKGKRKIDVIDFFSNEKRKIPKLDSGLVPSSISHIKEEDITLQIGLQYTKNNEEEESLEQAYKRALQEMAEMKTELQRLGEEKSAMTEEINRLNNMVAHLRDSNYYRIALLPKAHQGNPTVMPNHTVKRMFIGKQRRENFQVLDHNQRMPHI